MQSEASPMTTARFNGPNYPTDIPALQMRPPFIVGFCGEPGCGKSEAAMAMERIFGCLQIDDGWPMRDFAIRHLGATVQDVTTQAGKAGTTTFASRTMTWREVLGNVGNALEGAIHPHVIPIMAIAKCQPNGRYTLSSVRRDQGAVVRAAGGYVVEIVRPGAPQSPHEFDRFDRQYVDFRVINDGSVQQLESDLRYVFGRIISPL